VSAYVPQPYSANLDRLDGTAAEQRDALDLDVWITQPGDADYVLDLVTTSGSPVVTSATANWPIDCVGKPIAIANGLGNGVKLRTTILSRQSSTQITLATNCTRTNANTASGAVYGTDFGPILQDALDQLDSRHGGVVRFTPGRRFLFTPVAKVFGSANHVEIDGQGSSFCLSVPQGEDGLVLTNSDILTLRNIAFIGCQNEIEDAHRCISVSAIKKVNLFNLDCHALASCLLADGAVIDVSQTLLRMRDCNVSGCTASANLDTGVVLLRAMLGTKVENLTMLDWSNFGGSILTKTGVSSPIAWVKVSEPGQGSPTSAPMRYGPFTFDSCYFDEAAVNAILVQSSDVKFRSVCVRDCRVNVTNLGTGSGLRIEDAELVEIVDTSIGYTANAVPGIRILDCGTAILRRVKTDGGAAEVLIDSSTDHVLVEDCDIGTLTSSCTDTVVKRSNESVFDGLDCTKAPYNCDPTGVADSTSGLNSFFSYCAANNVGVAKCDGTFKISGQVTAGPASGESVTKRYQGDITLQCVGTFTNALLLRGFNGVTWDGNVKAIGSGADTLYASRTVVNGVVFQGVNNSIFDSIDSQGFLGDCLFVDASSTQNNNNLITKVSSVDCGSCGVSGSDSYSVVGTWGTRSDTGSSGIDDQRSTITLSALPPSSTDSIKKTILIDGVPHDVISMNRGSSAVTIFPWILPLATTSGSYRFVFGSAIRFTGNETSNNTVEKVSSFRSGSALAVESVVGPSVGTCRAQTTGISIIVGSRYDATMTGVDVSRHIGQSDNHAEFLLKTRVGKRIRINTIGDTDASKIRNCVAGIATAFNAPNPSFNFMYGCSFGTSLGELVPNKPINNTEILTGTVGLDIGVSRSQPVGYYGDYLAVGLELPDESVISRLGIDTFAFTGFGSGANGQPQFTITIYPMSGWKINGGTVNAAAVFSGFSGPATMRGYLNLAAKNIVIGKA
jgi:hypothetical protein